MVNEKENELNGLEIAVTGMSGRFPGANNVSEFWENLKNGLESVSFFSHDELRETGPHIQKIQNPNFIKSSVVFEGREYFDAAFFDFTPTQARLMDPQIRIFHQCVWEALEDSGYDPETYNGLIGLFAGAGKNFGWEAKSLLSGMTNILGEFEAGQLIRRDSICSLTAYKLNLKGPCISLNTACSTSLVAIHLACQALLNGECDIALAGGIWVADAQAYGYLYQEGMIYSPDGHCRAFDAQSKGTISGEGTGIVVLKRFHDAHQDHIYAVIKGSAMNNDGMRKVGYTAPSVKGQVEVIKTALRMAEVSPETITYIEAHGTGTVLGDTIELESLTQAFNTKKRAYCGIGSIKSNIGHLGEAAGVAGFIKTVLALKHKLIPPTLNIQNPNPKINNEKSPFYVNTRLKKWKSSGFPLRAGVSSFGIGGTNAHVILEEEAEMVRQTTEAREYQLMVLSAKTPSILDKMRKNLAGYLKKNSDINIADAAYTLKVGRRIFPYRCMFVTAGIQEAVNLLNSKDSRKLHTLESTVEKAPVVFLFSGLGSQYVNMGSELYRCEKVFKEGMDRCFQILKSLGYDLAAKLYPRTISSARDIDCINLSQAAIFAVEYALTKLIISWGIKPWAMMGYSFGEYTAAFLAGVFSLEDVLKLIISRGEIIKKAREGKMVSVPISKNELTGLLNDELAIAIDNGPSCVVSGSVDAVETFEKKMKEKRCLCIPLKGAQAIHSPMMTPIIEEFKKNVGQIQINNPGIPFISNITGKWITPDEAVDPGYWAKHLRETVRFSEGLKTLSSIKNPVFIEIGPGHDLSLIVKSCWHKEFPCRVLNLLKHQQQNIPDNKFLLTKLGQLWHYGVEIDWSKFYSEEKRYRISLPTYPFDQQYYWFDPGGLKRSAEFISNHLMTQQHQDADGKYSYYIPSWKHCRLPAGNKTGNTFCLIFVDDTGFGSRLAAHLKQEGMKVIPVKKGKEFQRLDHNLFEINPENKNDYQQLFEELSCSGEIPHAIFHAWNITGEGTPPAYYCSKNTQMPEEKSRNKNTGLEGSSTEEIPADITLDDIYEYFVPGFTSLMHLAAAIGDLKEEKEFKIIVLSNHVQEVIGEDINILKSLLLGPVNWKQDNKKANIRFYSVDVVINGNSAREEKKLFNHILTEMRKNTQNPEVSYRNNKRWVKFYEPLTPEKSKEEPGHYFKPDGVYLITGELKGIGFTLAKHLLEDVGAKLILPWNPAYPLRNQWKTWLENHEEDDLISVQIKYLQELGNISPDILILRADMGNPNQMQEVANQGIKWFGRFNGIIHTVYTHDTGDEHQSILQGIKELFILDQISKNRQLDCCIVFSSLPPRGGDIISNTINHFAEKMITRQNHKNSFPWIGISIDATMEKHQWWKISRKLLASGESGPLVISNIDIKNRINDVDDKNFKSSLSMVLENEISNSNMTHSQQTPGISNDYTAPRDELEKKIAAIWEEILGFHPVGIYDNFFDLNGSSLTATQIMSRIKELYQAEIPLKSFLEQPTIEYLAVLIKELSAEEVKNPPINNKQ